MGITKIISATGASAGWGTAAADVLGIIDLDVAHSQFALAVALSLTAGLMLCVRRRPLGAAYDLGFDDGYKHAMRSQNGPGGGRVVQFRKRDLEPCGKTG